MIETSSRALVRSAVPPRATPDGFLPGQPLSRDSVADLRMRFAGNSYNAEAHTVEVVLSSGSRVQRFGIVEELEISATAIDLSRVERGMVPFLDSHDQSSTDAKLGTVVRTWIQGNQLLGLVRFDRSNERARAIEQRVAAGELPGISIGYQVVAWTLMGNDNNTEIWRATRWTLLEGSSVVVPADPSAAVRSAQAPLTTTEHEDMRRNQPGGAAPAAPATPPPSTAALDSDVRASVPATPAVPSPSVDSAGAIRQAVTDAVGAERVRVSTIADIGRRGGIPDDVVRTALEAGETIDAFRSRAFDVLAERSRQAPTSSVNASIVRDERDTIRRGMADAIVARLARASGERNVQIPEHARAYGEMGFAEMAAEAIGHRGHLRTPRQVIEVFERAFHSTSDFPGIFGDALNNRLLARYQVAAPTYRRFAAPYTAVDFRTINVVRAGDFPSLQRVLETGEIKAGSFSESKEQLVVYPYGVRFNISRQMLVNDNLGAINQVLGSSGDRVLDWENAQVFASLVSNSFAGPTLLTDTTAVFATGHGNHVTSGTAIDITSLGLGRAAMMKQTSLDGLKLNLMPTTIMTGPDKLTSAEQLVATINPALIASAQPDWVKRLTPVGDANITGNHWYLFADPAVAPCWVYGMLQGYEGPRLSTDDPFTVQGIEVKLEHDFGVAAIDYRGAYHNAGA